MYVLELVIILGECGLSKLRTRPACVLRTSVWRGAESGGAQTAAAQLHSPQDVVAHQPAVVAVGAGDEQQHLAGALHALQPGLHRV